MNKFEFLTQLRAKLWGVPESDAQRSVDYYSEMIDDRMDEGLSEEEAVAAVGDLDEIVKQILQETPRAPGTAEAPKKHRTWQTWEIVLLILGSPVWVPLLIAAAAIIFSVCVTLWSVVISLYVTAVALGASAIGCILAGFFMAGTTSGTIFAALGAALLCAGLAILFFMLANLAAKGMVALTKLTWNSIFRRKEQAV